MSKRFILLLVSSLFLFALALPAAAQSPHAAADLVPADFAGFIRLDTTDARVPLQGMNEATLAAAIMQPTRVDLGSSARLYFDFIPFAPLFDVETATFAANILPWLGDDLVLAYRTFDGALQANPDDMLIILSTHDMLGAISDLGTIIRGQDIPERDSYRGITLYIGDKTTIAVTEEAVFIGPTELVKAALDVQAGTAPALTAQPAYAALHSSTPEDAFATAYITSDYILPAVNGLLNGNGDSQPLLKAFGGALATQRQSFESLLLDGGFDGAEVSLMRDRFGRNIRAAAVFHNANTDETTPLLAPEVVDPALLEMIPKNALLVHSGADFRSFVNGSFNALPLSNFAGQIVSGLPFTTAGTTSPMVSVPAASDIEGAVKTFFDTLKTVGGYDIETDLLAHLNGGYALALLPRPNNRLPVLDVPFDLLLVGQVDDGATVSKSVVTLLETVLDVKAEAEQTVGDWTLTPLTNNGDLIFTVAHTADRLMVASGTSAKLALDAGRGDDRLVNLPGWKQFAEGTPPGLYVDAFMFYNTFFPVEMLTGGFVVSESNRQRLAASTHIDADGLYHLDLTVTLPQG
ncbi:MAG: DUF3352 domain-containing protein [Anaerolineae bacterium]